MLMRGLFRGSVRGLVNVRQFLDDAGIGTVVVGNGSNILFPDEGLKKVIISLESDAFRKIQVDDNIVSAGAGAKLGELISRSSKKGLAGMEGLVGIPATVGGAVWTNAGYIRAVSDMLLKCLVLDSEGHEKWITKDEITFGDHYADLRGRGIILEAVFELDGDSPEMLQENIRMHFHQKMDSQPLEEKTLGCIFRNPDEGTTAGGLIDSAGLKGRRCGGAEVSDKHANFIVNTGVATSANVRDLISTIQKEVNEKFSIKLETEIEVI